MKAFLEGLSAPFKSCFGWIAIGLLFVLFSIMLSGCVSHRVYDIPQSRDSADEELSSKFTATYTWPEWRINVIANSANHD